MLYTARLDTFEHDFYVERLNLETIVRGVTSEQKRLFIRKRVFPAIQIDEQITVTTDEKWLTFVLTQLITNAVRYTTEEGKHVFSKGWSRKISRLCLRSGMKEWAYQQEICRACSMHILPG